MTGLVVEAERLAYIDELLISGNTRQCKFDLWRHLREGFTQPHYLGVREAVIPYAD